MSRESDLTERTAPPCLVRRAVRCLSKCLCVAGIVLVDARPERLALAHEGYDKRAIAATRTMLGAADAIARTGILKLIGQFVPMPGGLPAEFRRRRAAVTLTRDAIAAMRLEADHVAILDEQVRLLPAPPPLPIKVITHGRVDWLPKGVFSGDEQRALEATWRQLQRELAATPRGALITATDAGHFVQLETPGVVASAIRELLAPHAI